MAASSIVALEDSTSCYFMTPDGYSFKMRIQDMVSPKGVFDLSTLKETIESRLPRDTVTSDPQLLQARHFCRTVKRIVVNVGGAKKRMTVFPGLNFERPESPDRPESSAYHKCYFTLAPHPSIEIALSPSEMLTDGIFDREAFLARLQRLVDDAVAGRSVSTGFGVPRAATSSLNAPTRPVRSAESFSLAQPTPSPPQISQPVVAVAAAAAAEAEEFVPMAEAVVVPSSSP